MRKRLFILTAVLIIPINFLFAQITFQKTYGGANDESGYAAKQTVDGGYIIVGNTGVFLANNDNINLIKTSADGNLLWTKTYGGADVEYGYSVQQTIDSGYIIAGITKSFGAGLDDIYLLKTDVNGNLIWSKTFGGGNIDVVGSVRQTADSGYIIAGGTGGFLGHAYLIKTNSNGDSLWTRIYSGSGIESFSSAVQTSDGGFIISGSTNSFGAGNNDAYLVKTDNNGNFIWAKTYGTTGGEGSSQVQQTADGGFIILGSMSAIGSGNSDMYLVKTDSSGNLLWSKAYGSPGNDYGYSIQQTNDTGYIITGSTSLSVGDDDDICLIKTDVNGDTLWTHIYGSFNNERGYYGQQTSDGGYLMAGITRSFGLGNADLYLIKTDTNGNSGCYQTNTIINVSAPATQVSSPSPIITGGGTVSSPATIVGSGGAENNLCTNVGVNEITSMNAFRVSPNPSAGNLIVEFQMVAELGDLEITDIFGKIVYSENSISESKIEINVLNISDGIYFVKVFDGKKHFCKKIIIKKN